MSYKSTDELNLNFEKKLSRFLMALFLILSLLLKLTNNWLPIAEKQSELNLFLSILVGVETNKLFWHIFWLEKLVSKVNL